MPTYLRQQKYPFGSLRTDPHWSTQGLGFYSQFKPSLKLIDETAFKNDGVITGATWVGDGLDFDNTVSSDKVETTILPDPRCTTLIARLSFNDVSRNATNVMGAHDGSNRFYLGLDADENIFVGMGDSFIGAGTANVASGLISGVAATMAVVGDGTTAFVYINGILKASFAYTASAASTEPLWIGSRSGIASDIDGVVFETKFYNRALNASEILGLYRTPDILLRRDPVLGKVPAVVGTTPKGPLTHPLYGPFAGPIAC